MFGVITSGMRFSEKFTQRSRRKKMRIKDVLVGERYATNTNKPVTAITVGVPLRYHSFRGVRVKFENGQESDIPARDLKCLWEEWQESTRRIKEEEDARHQELIKCYDAARDFKAVAKKLKLPLTIVVHPLPSGAYISLGATDRESLEKTTHILEELAKK